MTKTLLVPDPSQQQGAARAWATAAGMDGRFPDANKANTTVSGGSTEEHVLQDSRQGEGGDRIGDASPAGRPGALSKCASGTYDNWGPSLVNERQEVQDQQDQLGLQGVADIHVERAALERELLRLRALDNEDE